MLTFPDITFGHGSGSGLPLPVLALAGVSTVVAVLVSGASIWLQLRNYRKPLLQRMVVRIMVMVPLYAVSSFISLFSLEAAFFIDAVRDIYEAFVIYCFFVLLLDYLGGERSLLILLHGRPPIPAVFPVSLWHSEIDQSDPYIFLFLKRGILQYVQVKPLLALASLIMKATGTYNEGDFRARSGYLYVSIVYNISICLALWCLAVFWMCVHDDLKPFRPVPKFLCVKGILFFSFWQSIGVSFLVAVGIITRLGPYTDSEHISLGLTDTLICVEMPFFAAAHMYAFSYRDFTTPPASVAGMGKGCSPIHVARMALGYALRDAFGLKDLVEDTRTTLRGEGINYRAFEPSEGGMHIGAARDRRIRAGLRYAAGGKRKYWLPESDEEAVIAPLFSADADDDDVPAGSADVRVLITGDDDDDARDEDEYALTFGDALVDPQSADGVLYEHAKKYVFGDYRYPVVDVSSEEARQAVWEQEERIVRDIASGGYSRSDGASTGYGATQSGVGLGARSYAGDDDAGTPPPPRSRAVSDCPPVTSRSGGSSTVHPSRPHTPAPSVQHSARLHLPRLLPSLSLSSSSSSGTTSSSVTASPRASSKRAGPLVEEDAVDLVVSADRLQVPGVATSKMARGSHSPHSPVLIRIWDEFGPGLESEPEPGPGSDQHGDTVRDTSEGTSEPDVQFVITVDDDAGRETEERRGQFEVRGEGDGDDDDGAAALENAVTGEYTTPLPPSPLYAHGQGFGGLEVLSEEDDHNPWA